MQNYYQFMVSRLNGARVRSDFRHYLSLVQKGIAGFIIFGGELETVRSYVRRLQDAAGAPLIIASDLERGLGQQLRGGTHLPPAMAIAKAFGKDCRRSASRPPAVLRKAFRNLAEEAAYAGINTIFAPVLDINTNPKNPIIAARAFGEDRETVSWFGCAMIRTLQRSGIAACGKHFPGHGDTGVDSHMRLPVIERGLSSLRRCELYPFRQAAGAGVKMIMLGHLSVPALDPSGLPVSLSEKAVGFLRRDLMYRGILITDAMNMGGIGKYSEEQASFMALEAGVDILLHPTDPHAISVYLGTKSKVFDTGRVAAFREGLVGLPSGVRPDFEENRELAAGLTERAIQVSGTFRMKGTPYLLIINDEGDARHRTFVNRFREHFPAAQVRIVDIGTGSRHLAIPESTTVMTAIFSETRGWKGGATRRLYRCLSSLEEKTDLFISFGSPYLLDDIRGVSKMFVYWDSEPAQQAAADRLLEWNRSLT